MVQAKHILSLIKYRVSIAVTFTAITGYVIYLHHVDYTILFLILGVFALASGASGLNEVQESPYDALMERTRNRPLPTGKMSRKQGFWISCSFIFAGTAILYTFFQPWAALLGVFNIFWYNGIYTPLKRISAFAVVPGSLVGAIPALIGWVAAGGYQWDTTILTIGFFLFIWQVPHFWLLMIKYGKQYEQAGYPTINQTMGPENLKSIILTWIIATSACSVMIPLFLKQISILFFIAVFVLNIVFVGFFVKMAFGNITELNFKKSFISINVYMMVFMLSLIVYHLF